MEKEIGHIRFRTALLHAKLFDHALIVTSSSILGEVGSGDPEAIVYFSCHLFMDMHGPIFYSKHQGIYEVFKKKKKAHIYTCKCLSIYLDVDTPNKSVFGFCIIHKKNIHSAKFLVTSVPIYPDFLGSYSILNVLYILA